MTILKKLGFNKHVIDDLFNIALNETDKYFEYSSKVEVNKVSPQLLNLSKIPLKLNKALTNSGIYSIAMLNIKTECFTIMAKTSTGVKLSEEVPRWIGNRKEAFTMALIKIVNKIINLENPNWTETDNLKYNSKMLFDRY